MSITGGKFILDPSNSDYFSLYELDDSVSLGYETVKADTIGEEEIYEVRRADTDITTAEQIYEPILSAVKERLENGFSNYSDTDKPVSGAFTEPQDEVMQFSAMWYLPSGGFTSENTGYAITGTADIIKERLEHGLLDFGFLLEPIDIEKFDYLRLPTKEVWGVILPADHQLASEKAITRQQLRELPLVVTSRNDLRGEIEEWLKYPVSELYIVATFNLIDNVAPLAERGIACVLCVEGAVDMFDPARYAFRPLQPELSMTSVLAWKKLSPYAGAAGKFLEYIKSIHSEHIQI
ncbi:LysR family transcriptional regulator substrate-binding protein [Ruminococcus flavefaciens]|uniref:LysR family transcriptional regulator substrate-binding protein n=1 Tax=Ruminococcus flavefaciens TaxID=1265 RepID=UPI0015647CF4|nr:LysR family transcriptional regulator substrate-binding protein [Ruminococcus flavefaciens]